VYDYFYMTRARDGYLVFFAVAALITVFLFFLNVFLGPTYGGDSEWYIAAANGRLNELIEPYSTRFLHPFLVGWISHQLPLDIHQTFLVVTVASVFLFMIVNVFLLKDTVRSPFLLIPLFFLPYFFATLREIFQPDAFYILLTALFFLLLRYKMEGGCLVTLFLLFLARESTMLLGLIFAAIGWLRSKKFLAITAIGVVMISLYTMGVMRNAGQPNIHHLSTPVYMVFKFSYNSMTNVLGLKPWINTHSNCEPAFRFRLPPLKSLGSVREVGFCGFDLSLPAQTIITLLTTFGIAPLVLFYVLRKRKGIIRSFPFWMLIALIYGIAHYFIGVAAGTGVQRLVGYGWPAFLVVVPILIQKLFEADKKIILKLSLVHLFVAWLPLLTYRMNGDTAGSAMFIIFLAMGAYCYAFRIIKEQKMIEIDVARLPGAETNVSAKSLCSG